MVEEVQVETAGVENTGVENTSPENASVQNANVENTSAKNSGVDTTSVEQLNYEASGARKTLLSFAFLMLLPFFVSLPVMLITRLRHGLWKDSVGLGIMAIAFTAVMAILLLQLIFAIRAKVTIGKKAVALSLPKGRGPTPKLGYDTRVIPFDDIVQVETRAEVYGAPLAPVLLRGARVVTRAGDNVSLGYVNEHDLDTFPVLEIADNIARSAGIKVADRGTVRRSLRAKALGKKHSPDQAIPLESVEIDALNARHRKVVVGFIAFLLALLATGILMDYFNA